MEIKCDGVENKFLAKTERMCYLKIEQMFAMYK